MPVWNWMQKLSFLKVTLQAPVLFSTRSSRLSTYNITLQILRIILVEILRLKCKDDISSLLCLYTRFYNLSIFIFCCLRFELTPSRAEESLVHALEEPWPARGDLLPVPGLLMDARWRWWCHLAGAIELYRLISRSFSSPTFRFSLLA